MLHTLPRIFIENITSPAAGREEWRAGGSIVLDRARTHYLLNVLRRGAGDGVRLFDGVNGEWEARIARADRKALELRLEKRIREQTPTRDRELLFAPLKKDATDLAIRMGTELGVTRFRPVITAYANTHRLNYERLHAIALEAAEQCERLDVPVIKPLEPLASVLACWRADKKLLCALERTERTSGEAGIAAVRGIDSLLVGPEGGFSPEEREGFRRYDFFRYVSLGARVLKAETAVCAGLALMENA